MDKVVPKDQSPEDLILNIVRGSIQSKEHFRVFETGFVECQDIFARVETIHGYPNKDSVVFTTAAFDF